MYTPGTGSKAECGTEDTWSKIEATHVKTRLVNKPLFLRQRQMKLIRVPARVYGRSINIPYSRDHTVFNSHHYHQRRRNRYPI